MVRSKRLSQILFSAVASAALFVYANAPAGAETVPLPPKPPSAVKAAEKAAKTGGKSETAKAQVKTEAKAEAAKADVQVANAPVPPKRPKGHIPNAVERVSDYQSLRAAIYALGKNDFSEARAHAAKLTEPVSRALFQWVYARDSSLNAGHARIFAFVRDHPDWPQRDLLRARLEASLYGDKARPAAVLASLTPLKPWTGAGKTALALAYDAAGNTPEAIKWARESWRDHSLSRSQEEAIYSTFKGKLTAADHAVRLNLLLYDDDFDGARRVATRLSPDAVKLVEARQAVSKRSRNAEGLLDKLPPDARKEPVALLSRVQYLRRKDDNKTAAKLLSQAPQDAESLIDVSQWWVERKILCRRMLDDNDPQTAYELAANHGAIEGVAFAEAEFLAGWIALRYLDNPKQALHHFQTLTGGVKTDLSRSRGLYWTARAHEAASNIEAARSVYEEAGEYFTTYYGQLALLKLGRDAKVEVPPLPAGTSDEQRAFEAKPLVQAVRLLHEMGENGLVRVFLLEMAKQFEDEVDVALTGRLSAEFGMSNVTVRIGKVAGAMVPRVAFPTDAIPDYQPRGAQVEEALVHAIARQESEFRHDVVSPAGARGLMQLMPATAKATARNIGLAYKSASLTSDPAYNVTIGSAHLGELIASFNGSYIMTIAGYNAGPRRVYQWIEAFGDPREPGVDPIDWIERIPFTETRNYVQRVLENLQIYRAALNGGSHPVHLAGDLTRGR